jgi:predicted MFS family arabinose efflux permease
MAVSFGVCFANLTTLINNRLGWRKASLIVSIMGTSMAFLAIFLSEPRRSKILMRQEILKKGKD